MHFSGVARTRSFNPLVEGEACSCFFSSDRIACRAEGGTAAAAAAAAATVGGASGFLTTVAAAAVVTVVLVAGGTIAVSAEDLEALSS